MVSTDTIYQRVLAIANKEQRGYITPQEFNLYANLVQMEIFDQYFYDLNQFSRLHGNDTGHADMVDLLEEKINIFADSAPMGAGAVNEWIPSTTPYKVTSVFYTLDSKTYVGERVTQKEAAEMSASPLAKPSPTRPVWYDTFGKIIVLGPTDLSGSMNLNFIKRPGPVRWGYVVVNEQAMYDQTNTEDFELHDSEENNLVYKILKLAGISLDTGVYEAGANEEMKNIQQEKQ